MSVANSGMSILDDWSDLEVLEMALIQLGSIFFMVEIENFLGLRMVYKITFTSYQDFALVLHFCVSCLGKMIFCSPKFDDRGTRRVHTSAKYRSQRSSEVG